MPCWKFSRRSRDKESLGLPLEEVEGLVLCLFEPTTMNSLLINILLVMVEAWEHDRSCEPLALTGASKHVRGSKGPAAVSSIAGLPNRK